MLKFVVKTTKCQQKSCQRNANINLKSGFCNVCEDVVQDTTNKLKQKNQSKILMKKVDLDYMEMVKMHDKLSKSEVNNPDLVNGLILGGIINILVQHDAIEELEDKMKALDEENYINKARIESLETWNSKQSEEIQKLANQLKTLDEDGVIVKENNEFNNLKRKLINLEIDMLPLKPLSQLDSQKEKLKNTKSEQDLKIKSKACHLCGITFAKNCDIERHMKEVHEAEKKYKCVVCEKNFFLEWRRTKHMQIHTDDVNYCHFYNNNKQCPFQEIGCMFLHKTAKLCTFKDCGNKLCQFRHEDQADTVCRETEKEVDTDHTDVEEEENEEKLADYQCNICMEILNSPEDLLKHFQNEHNKFYNQNFFQT